MLQAEVKRVSAGATGRGPEKSGDTPSAEACPCLGQLQPRSDVETAFTVADLGQFQITPCRVARVISLDPYGQSFVPPEIRAVAVDDPHDHLWLCDAAESDDDGMEQDSYTDKARSLFVDGHGQYRAIDDVRGGELDPRLVMGARD